MTELPRICFIGNCQAQALTSLAGHLGVAAEVVILPPVFQVARFNEPAVWQSIESCDFVFNQRVSETYEPEGLRPASIRQRFGDHSFSWPNIYFDGYFPGIHYLYSGDHGGKLTGPLSDYHFSTIRDAWQNGRGVSDCARDLMSDGPATIPSDPVERSLYQLRTREMALEVPISDYIATMFRVRKLFYSMNHPADEVLLEMLRRLLARAGIAIQWPDRVATYPYTLNKIDIPALPVFSRNYHPHFRGDAARIKGVSLTVTPNYAGEGPAAATYSIEDLVACYFRLYDWYRDRSVSPGPNP